MRGDEHRGRKVNQKRRKAEDDGAHELGKADMPFREAVVKQVAGLHNEERDVRVAGIQIER